ncbi:capsid protein precursor [Bat astrovirus Tm/Guangxi/LD77/2007]|uniref:Capsid protein n=1 Tax=Mamastrovirus 15 TaxID=1239579 RepID=C0KCT8_9VIRU|nr:capsid protein precursor [Bat astrovirus Tm/Guangxi/LD77/2007]ACN88710.1 capsid protein precursor [Bat astrovirus Tm/Guangxi/LD77/2007]
MAASPRQVKQEIKQEVKKEVKKEEVKKWKNKKKWNKKFQNKNFKKQVKKEVKKEVEKDQGGPKSKFSVNVTATIGYVDGNKEHGPTLKIATFLHPSLCKGPDEDRTFGPLQAAAAQYGLWRLSKVHIRMTPLVGSSAVSGTVVRLSANLTQTPGSTSWGGLGARKHRDFHAGRSGAFILTRRDVAGPRAGGWWVTDTNTEGAQSAGPVIEAHCLGKTSSTYQNADWSGQLFIVELTGRWEFSNYNMNPALGSLERHESETPNAKLSTDAGGEIQLELPTSSAAARFMNDPTLKRGGNAESTGEIVYQIVDTAAGLASSALPPPFNWLIKGGWWFVKKAIGRANATEVFKVYASLADAQNNKPAISSQKSMQGTAVNTNLQITQMNSPNLGGANVVFATGASPQTPIFPLRPSGTPSGEFMLLTNLQPVHMHATTAISREIPAFFPGSGLSTIGGKNFPAVHFRILNSDAFTLDGESLTSWASVQGMQTPFQLRLNKKATGTTGQMAVLVLANSVIRVGQANHTSWFLHTILWKSANDASETWATMDNETPMIITRPGGTTDEYRWQNLSTRNVVATNSTMIGSYYLSAILVGGKNALQEINSGNSPNTTPFNMDPLGEFNSLLGVLLQSVLRQGAGYSVHSLRAFTRSESKMEKLARLLGVELSTDEESDISDDDDSLCSDQLEISESDSEYQVIADPEKEKELEKLGFSKEQILKIMKA